MPLFYNNLSDFSPLKFEKGLIYYIKVTAFWPKGCCVYLQYIFIILGNKRLFSFSKFLNYLIILKKDLKFLHISATKYISEFSYFHCRLDFGFMRSFYHYFYKDNNSNEIRIYSLVWSWWFFFIYLIIGKYTINAIYFLNFES